MPANRENRSRRSSSECTNPWYFICLSGFARCGRERQTREIIFPVEPINRAQHEGSAKRTGPLTRSRVRARIAPYLLEFSTVTAVFARGALPRRFCHAPAFPRPSRSLQPPPSNRPTKAVLPHAENEGWTQRPWIGAIPVLDIGARPCYPDDRPRPKARRLSMTPAARVAAAIEVLGDIETRRRPAAEAMKDWGLSHRFAGSGDRAAISSLVYDGCARKARRRGSSARRARAGKSSAR